MIIENLNITLGTQEIFNNVNITINKNSKVGIVGVNGAGKTTLFNTIMGKIESSKGKIILEKNTRVLLLPQIIPEEVFKQDMSVFEFLLSGRPIQKLEEEKQLLYNKLVNTKNTEKIYKQITKIENELIYWEEYKAESILLKLITGVNITSEILDQKMSTLSGGQKSKVAFTRLLYQKPEIILLDEPTNHLDKDSKDFIIDYLKKYNGSVFIISHEKEFLDSITDKILHIDKRTKDMKLFSGNYTAFTKQLEENKKHLAALVNKELNEESKLKAYLQTHQGIAHRSEKGARSYQDRKRKLEKLQSNKTVIQKDNKKLKFKIKIKQPGSHRPLCVKNLSFKYQKDATNYLLTDITFDLTRGEKFLIVGRNGIGKSTLLKLIMGNLKPDTGKIDIGANVEIAYYAQEHELLENEKTIYDNFENLNLNENQLRSVLGNFLFHGDEIFKKVNILSPGERSRVALAKLAIKEANFLILDEPTNHLDPDSQKIIAEVFRDYPGTMLIVSHNPEFVDNLNIDRILLLPDSQILYYDKNIVTYFENINKEK